MTRRRRLFLRCQVHASTDVTNIPERCRSAGAQSSREHKLRNSPPPVQHTPPHYTITSHVKTSSRQGSFDLPSAASSGAYLHSFTPLPPRAFPLSYFRPAFSFSGNGEVLLPFGSSAYVGLGFSVFAMLVRPSVRGAAHHTKREREKQRREHLGPGPIQPVRCVKA